MSFSSSNCGGYQTLHESNRKKRLGFFHLPDAFIKILFVGLRPFYTMRMPAEWITTRANTVSVAGFRVMHGEPTGGRLREHEHVETQLEVHYRSQPETRTPSELCPGETVIIPPRRPHVGDWENSSEVVVLLIPPIAFERAADEILAKPKFEIREQNLSYEPLVHSLCSSIRDQFCSHFGVSRLFVECAGGLLAEHILINYADTTRALLIQDSFTEAEVRRITAFVDEQLENGITVAKMARTMRMGLHRFAQNLRRSTGRSPYQFVQMRRVQLAKMLFQQNTVDLAEISARLGFASQSHFTEVFRRATGLTPKAYRDHLS
jgi:AraC family transcriptional regulator